MSGIVKTNDSGICLNIYVQPGTSQNRFAGQHLDRLKVKISAKAVDGAANDSLRKFVAHHFEVPKGNVQIIRGLSSREKTLRIIGNPTLLSSIAEELLE